EAGPGSRAEGHARCPVELLHEEPADADPRRHRVQPRRGVHPRRRQRDARRDRGTPEAPAPQARQPAGLGRRGGGEGGPRQGGGRRVSPAAGGAKSREQGLGAPVSRSGRGPRPVEKAAIYAYRVGAWLMGHLPVPVARGIVSVLLQLSFLLWPKKRRSVNDNF